MPTDSGSDSGTSSWNGAIAVNVDLSVENEPAMTILETVSDLADRPIEDFPPLAHTIDPNALNQLFDAKKGMIRTEGEFTFTYKAYTITVTSSGDIRINHP